MPLTEQSSSVTDVVAVGPGWGPGASHSGWLQLPGRCRCKGFFAAPWPSPSTDLYSFFSGVPFPCSHPPLRASLLLVPPGCPTSSQRVLFITSSFLFFNTQTHRFYFRKAQRRGKATSVNFLDHFSTGEYNNYFSPFLFSCLDPMQRPALSPHRHTVSARMLNATSQFLQPPSLMAAVQVPVGCSWHT